LEFESFGHKWGEERETVGWGGLSLGMGGRGRVEGLHPLEFLKIPEVCKGFSLGP
jgi:hypothetical protein